MSEEALAALRRIQHIHNPIPDSIFANDLATIRAALEESGRDAERYRWLREHGAWETEAFLGSLTAEQYDAAIDAARAAEGG